MTWRDGKPAEAVARTRARTIMRIHKIPVVVGRRAGERVDSILGVHAVVGLLLLYMRILWCVGVVLGLLQGEISGVAKR